MFRVLLHRCACVQDTAVLNVVNLTAVKIVAPIKRLQTKTQVNIDKSNQKSTTQLTCNMYCIVFASLQFYWFVLCMLC